MDQQCDETAWAMAVHDLILSLNSFGIGLVLLPPPRSTPGTDIVEALKNGARSFALDRSWSETGTHLLVNYLSDHLYERGPDGHRHVPVDKNLLVRATDDLDGPT